MTYKFDMNEETETVKVKVNDLFQNTDATCAIESYHLKATSGVPASQKDISDILAKNFVMTTEADGTYITLSASTSGDFEFYVTAITKSGIHSSQLFVVNITALIVKEPEVVAEPEPEPIKAPNTPPTFKVAPLPFLDVTVFENETTSLEDFTYNSLAA